MKRVCYVHAIVFPMATYTVCGVVMGIVKFCIICTTHGEGQTDGRTGGQIDTAGKFRSQRYNFNKRLHLLRRGRVFPLATGVVVAMPYAYFEVCITVSIAVAYIHSSNLVQEQTRCKPTTGTRLVQHTGIQAYRHTGIH